MVGVDLEGGAEEVGGIVGGALLCDEFLPVCLASAAKIFTILIFGLWAVELN